MRLDLNHRIARWIDVYLDGDRITAAIYADTNAGIVVHYPQPLRVIHGPLGPQVDRDISIGQVELRLIPDCPRWVETEFAAGVQDSTTAVLTKTRRSRRIGYYRTGPGRREIAREHAKIKRVGRLYSLARKRALREMRGTTFERYWQGADPAYFAQVGLSI